jgi:hypothetical protein
MKMLGWILAAFAFGGIVGSHFMLVWTLRISDDWKKLYYDLKAECCEEEPKGE